ncbi:conserved hypothetical protein [Roseibium sp. TrichSKD4]|uniref:DUF2293 domain-containing protein n=1 Tax=Roseibium sp. TrichSKD4 TaxID=744980 RepID=UPI0001E56A0F|nr:DUF2293 domain-containing protein [Roseibium sp. TrichSKD4]EFO31092.1 conserved hypothetical protein [Roseibium sp. TrichSKD4]
MAGGTKRQKEARKALRTLIPRVPFSDAEAVLEKALSGHLRHLPPSIAVWQATTSYIRHEHTDYDSLLDEGYDRDAARFFVIDAMNDVLESWGSGQRLDADEETTISF